MCPYIYINKGAREKVKRFKMGSRRHRYQPY